MTHPGSGNPTWQGWPSTQTPITALALENIESALDNARPTPLRSAWAQSSASVSTVATHLPLTGLTPVSGMQDAPIRFTGGPGSFTFDAAGIWSLTYTAVTDSATNHWTMIQMVWINGAWWPATNGLTDKRIAMSGFGGSGGLNQVISWSGYVPPDVVSAPRPLQLTVAMSSASTASACEYRFIAEYQRPA